MWSGAVRKIPWTIVAGFGKGLVPFHHELVATGHGFGSHLTIPIAGMVSIPFGCPNIIRALRYIVLQLLNPGRLEGPAVGTTVSLLQS